MHAQPRNSFGKSLGPHSALDLPSVPRDHPHRLREMLEPRNVLMCGITSHNRIDGGKCQLFLIGIYFWSPWFLVMHARINIQIKYTNILNSLIRKLLSLQSRATPHWLFVFWRKHAKRNVCLIHIVGFFVAVGGRQS